jgi:Ca2+-dependent lipid-binding protein
VQFGFDKWHTTTTVHTNAGAESEWLISPQDDSMQLEVSPSTLRSSKLEVLVKDQNEVFSDTFIGSTQLDVSGLLMDNNFDREKEISTKIFSKDKKKETGTVVVVFILKEILKKKEEDSIAPPVKKDKDKPAEVEEKKPPPSSPTATERETAKEVTAEQISPSSSSSEGTDKLPLDFRSATLRITKVDAHHLKNVEGFLAGKNDPFVKFTFGEVWAGQTTELDEAGSEAEWVIPVDDRSMQFSVRPAELRALKMSVTAMDKNIALRGDALIGTGENYLHSALDKHYGEDCVVKFQLKDEKAKKAGEVFVHFQLQKNEDLPPSSTEEAAKEDPVGRDGKPVEPFTSGTIEIHTIKCINLKNVEIMGENDPYVKLAFSGSEWMDATPPLDNESTPVWKDLDMDIEVTADMMDEDRISVEVWDENTLRKDKLIGRGDSSVERLLQSLDTHKPIDIIIPLFDENKKRVGKAILYATLKRYVEKTSMVTEIDEAFKNGTVSIERIRAKNLLNTEIIGKQDPYVVLKLPGKSDLQTSFKEGGGSLVVWNSLDLRFSEVSREVMQTEKMAVEVWDHNDILSNKLIGQGVVDFSAAGAQLGDTVELVVDLETLKGAVAGKVVIDVKATEGVGEEEEAVKYEISEGFTEGKVHIKKISVFDAANTEMLGGLQDLYTCLSFKEWKGETAVQDDIGSDAVWEDLDMTFDVSAESLQSDFLTVQLFDDNLTKDTLIGSNEKVSLMQAGASVGKEVEIKVNLPTDKKGKSKGRLILYVEVREHEEEEEKFEVAEAFTSGCIHIEKICAYNLNGTTKNKKMTPSLKLKFVDFEESTEVSSGVNPVWNLLSIKAPATRDNLVNGKLMLEVFNRKKAIGTGEVSVAKAGASINEPVELRVEIVDKANVPFAYALINMTVKEESVDAAISSPKSSAQQEEIVLPPGFLQGIIYITSIKSFGLNNPDLLGKADPYVEVLFESKLGNFSEKTSVYTNAGGQAVWDEVNMKVKVSADDILANKKVKVNAWDENSGTDTHTGSGEITMRKLVKGFGNEVTLNIDLSDSKGKRAGRLVMVAELRESEPEPEAFLPKDFTAGVLKVIKICTFDLKNLEMIGRQDPYCKVRAGDFFNDQTFEKEDGGSDVVWDYLDMSIPVTAAFLTGDENILEFEAWESNLIKDAMIGRGEASLQKVVNIGEDVELVVLLRDDKLQSTGRLSVLVRLEPLPPKEIAIAPGFQEGTMSVRRIVAHGLKNKEWFGKADPFVCLTLDNWEGKTNSLTNEGSNVMWDFLDMKTVVTLDMLKAKDKKKHTITATVMDKNSLRSDVLIGTGEVNITKAFTTLGTEVELSVELQDEKQKPTGRLVLFALVTDGIEPDESDLKINPEFEFGTLNIGKIRSFDLKNTEIFGLQDPFVELQVGGWQDKTFTKDEGGGDVLWDFLDLHCDVTSAMLLTEKMSITVWDENRGRKNALIGRGECSLIKPGANMGQEVEVSVSLKDAKDKDSGRLVLYLTLQNEEELQEGVIPDSFTRGELQINRINGFSLKNTELVGKQDPYVVLKLGEHLDIKTKVLDSAGANPSWTHLGFTTVLGATAVKVEELEVQVWDKNTTADTLIGTGHVSLRRAASSLGTEVELRTQLTTKKGKPAGRINIGVLLKELPPEVVEKAIILPESFQSGIIHFHKIIAKGLQNKEFAGGKQVRKSYYFHII